MTKQYQCNNSYYITVRSQDGTVEKGKPKEQKLIVIEDDDNDVGQQKVIDTNNRGYKKISKFQEELESIDWGKWREMEKVNDSGKNSDNNNENNNNNIGNDSSNGNIVKVDNRDDNPQRCDEEELLIQLNSPPLPFLSLKDETDVDYFNKDVRCVTISLYNNFYLYFIHLFI